MKWKLLKLIGILAIAIVLFALPAIANAPAPPPMNWFVLSYPVGQQTLQGLQIAECNTATCEQPTLFIQYGECRDTGCLKPAAITTQIEDIYRFNCAENRCLLIDIVNTYSGNQTKIKDQSRWFRLIGQFSDRLRISPPVLKDPQGKNTVCAESHRTAPKSDRSPRRRSLSATWRDLIPAKTHRAYRCAH